VTLSGKPQGRHFLPWNINVCDFGFMHILTLKAFFLLWDQILSFNFFVTSLLNFFYFSIKIENFKNFFTIFQINNIFFSSFINLQNTQKLRKCFLYKNILKEKIFPFFYFFSLPLANRDVKTYFQFLTIIYRIYFKS